MNALSHFRFSIFDFRLLSSARVARAKTSPALHAARAQSKIRIHPVSRGQKSKILAAALFVLAFSLEPLAFPQTVPVRFSTLDFTGQPIARPITVTPDPNSDHTDGTNFIAVFPITLGPGPGPWTTNLWPGRYSVAISGLPRTWWITVPLGLGSDTPPLVAYQLRDPVAWPGIPSIYLAAQIAAATNGLATTNLLAAASNALWAAIQGAGGGPSGSGNGFPLSQDANANGYSITNLQTLQAVSAIYLLSGGSSNALATLLQTTNAAIWAAHQATNPLGSAAYQSSAAFDPAGAGAAAAAAATNTLFTGPTNCWQGVQWLTNLANNIVAATWLLDGTGIHYGADLYVVTNGQTLAPWRVWGWTNGANHEAVGVLPGGTLFANFGFQADLVGGSPQITSDGQGHLSALAHIGALAGDASASSNYPGSRLNIAAGSGVTLTTNGPQLTIASSASGNYDPIGAAQNATNALQSAAWQPSSAFDPAGAGATAALNATNALKSAAWQPSSAFDPAGAAQNSTNALGSAAYQSASAFVVAAPYGLFALAPGVGLGHPSGGYLAISDTAALLYGVPLIITNSGASLIAFAYLANGSWATNLNFAGIATNLVATGGITDTNPSSGSFTEYRGGWQTNWNAQTGSSMTSSNAITVLSNGTSSLVLRADALAGTFSLLNGALSNGIPTVQVATNIAQYAAQQATNAGVFYAVISALSTNATATNAVSTTGPITTSGQFSGNGAGVTNATGYMIPVSTATAQSISISSNSYPPVEIRILNLGPNSLTVTINQGSPQTMWTPNTVMWLEPIGNTGQWVWNY